MTSKNVLVTGAGFISCHLVKDILDKTNWKVTILSRLSNVGTIDKIENVLGSKHIDRLNFVWHDLRSPIHEAVANKLGQFNLIFHLAADTHVDDSILYPESFVLDNVLGTTHLLQFARTQKNLEKFFQFSTDEVHGAAPEGTDFKETDAYNAGNPYAASKAGAEQMAWAFRNTYGVPVITTRTMNVYGTHQHNKKFIPLVVSKVLQGETVSIHSNPDKTQAGKRKYIHTDNVSAALLFLEANGKVGEVYNIVGEREVDNLELAQMIAKHIGKPLKYEMVDFHSLRPGHDLRYSLDGSKLAALGFTPPDIFDNQINKIVDWYVKELYAVFCSN